MKIEMSKAEEEEALLTAYALGELDGDELAAVEARLEKSAEARAALEGIRETVALLEDGFSAEPPLALREEQVAAITTDGAGEKVVRGKFLSTMAVAACACLFAAVGWKQYLGGLEKSAAKSDYAAAEEAPAVAEPQVDRVLEDLFEASVASESVVPDEADKTQAPGDDSTDSMKRGAVVRVAPKAASSSKIVDPSVTGDWDNAPRELSRPAAKKAPGVRRSKSQVAAAPAPGMAKPEMLSEESEMLRGESFGRKGFRAGAVPSSATELGQEAKSRGVELKKMLSRDQRRGRGGADFVEVPEQIAKRRVSGADGERYGELVDNAWVSAWEDGLSTFAIDVDTGTYPNVRRFLKRRAAMPPKNAVRIEEMLNYFHYDYPEPEGEVPFSVTMELADCPWAEGNQLLRVGLKGRGLEADKRPASNLVFLVDVSGSMRGSDKLELLKRSMKAMVGQLGEDDRVGIVTYAGSSGVVLEPTHGGEKERIMGALDKLKAGGSTNGASGILTAYELAKANFVKGGTNRVILATDGDFNVGVTNDGALIKMVEERAREKVFLTVLGFGEGNLKEARMEQIADKGNGSYHYIDSEREGEKVLVRGLGATLVTVAKDVKVQLDFNPAKVSKYRLIGYANRMMPDKAFDDPKADAGEIGAGHTVTALYEIVPTKQDGRGAFSKNPQSKYREAAGLVESAESLTLKLNYKLPEGDAAQPTVKVPLKSEGKPWAQASGDFRFAAGVAGFGLLLRESEYAGTLNYDAVLELAREGVVPGGDAFGLRMEFLDLVKTAKSLAGAKD